MGICEGWTIQPCPIEEICWCCHCKRFDTIIWSAEFVAHRVGVREGWRLQLHTFQENRKCNHWAWCFKIWSSKSVHHSMGVRHRKYLSSEALRCNLRRLHFVGTWIQHPTNYQFTVGLRVDRESKSAPVCIICANSSSTDAGFPLSRPCQHCMVVLGFQCGGSPSVWLLLNREHKFINTELRQLHQ